MAVAAILPTLFIIAVTVRSEQARGFQKSNSAAQFGEILRPPPPPVTSIFPVPFHSGPGRKQRQNNDLGYNYEQPPPSSQLVNNFRPAPFNKQFNYNFVPPPQPFTTTPSSMFQKVSGWLFPTSQIGYDVGQKNSNLETLNKDCNPCNLVPWIPVIRYDLSGQNVNQNVNPTYGAPSPINSQISQFAPKPFNQQRPNIPNTITGKPFAIYGPPESQTVAPFATATPSSTYGPPSPTHFVDITSNSLNLQNSYRVPSPSYSYPNNANMQSSYTSTYNTISSSYGQPGSTYGPPSTTYGHPSATYGLPRPTSTTFLPITQNNNNLLSNYQSPIQTDDISTALSNELEVPKVNNPTGFRNSYGEQLTNTYESGFSYPPSATAAESSKIKTEVLPHQAATLKHNTSFSLSNPAPFSLHKGRNIHTLQPVALPNLSVSPLPPIFNARPFRPLSSYKLTKDKEKEQNIVQNPSNNIEILRVLPIKYPSKDMQTAIVQIDPPKYNQTKAYRNIVNSYVIDYTRDISSQASDHITTKTNEKINDHSFEITGPDALNELNMPVYMKPIKVTTNNKEFADLRGVSEDEVDKYRTESNLQTIDSPLLYLKPNIPHKEFDKFLIALSTPSNGNDYDIYDDIPTTAAPKLSTPTHIWDHPKDDKDNVEQVPTAQADSNKPKVVQIIIPYTTDQKRPRNHKYEDDSSEWASSASDENQPRKIPYNTENYDDINEVTENYDIDTTKINNMAVTDVYNPDINKPGIHNDLYDVKEPPFDIIKLQNNIDDWTEQQFSITTEKVQDVENNSKAKQIPEDYLTTGNPASNYVTTDSYDYYDHEGSSSVQQNINENNTVSKYEDYLKKKLKEKSKKLNEIVDDDFKPHIYTAASSFRTSTTLAPWGKISISPLTKEKIYVVTAKPWRENQNVTDWYTEAFEAMKGNGLNNEVSAAADDLPFKSPRFMNRPSFIGLDGPEIKYGLSENWRRSMNDVEFQDTKTKANLLQTTQVPAPIVTPSIDMTTEDTPTTEASSK